MAALVAWPRRGEEGSGSQCLHFIEGGQEGDWTRRSRFDMHKGEDHTIPIRGVYLNLHRRPPIPCEISPPNIYWRESQGDTQLSVVGGSKWGQIFGTLDLEEP